MKINDKSGIDRANAALNSVSVGKKGQGKAGGAEASKADRLDSAKVELSDRVKDMGKIRDAVNSTPDVDEAKVAKFKSLINSGQYKVDAGKVADKMVDEIAYQSIFEE